MLQTNDIGELFAQMQAAYGHQWAHKADAIPVWQRALIGCNRDELLSAIPLAIDTFTDFPPSIGQFKTVCESLKPRATTFLPAPTTSRAARSANLAMLRVLLKVGGVNSAQLVKLKQLKNALVEDLGNDTPTNDWVDNLEKEFRECADLQDHEAKAREREEARIAFCVRQGIPQIGVEQ